MDNRKYLVIGLIVIIVMSLGCVENVSPKSKIDERSETVVKEPVQSPIKKLERARPTPIPTSVNKLLVEHYSKQMDKLTQYVSANGPEYKYPSSGMTFMAINLKIINQGYPLININDFQWSLKVSTKDNPNTYIAADKMFYSNKDGIECKAAELENGGWTTCSVLFEVPGNYDQYKIYWNDFSDRNIEWKYVPK